MKKYLSVLFSLVVFSLFIPSIAPIRAQSLQIPNVYIKSIQLQKTDLKTGETVNGTFEVLTDAKTVASDVYFVISLVGGYQKNTLASTLYDSITTSSYELKAGETKTINFSYTIPQVKTGTGYGIHVQGMTHSGIPLGWSDVFIKITNSNKIQFLDTVNAKLVVGDRSFGLQEGPMVPVNKSAILDIVVKNPTSQSVTLTPTIDLYNHVVLGKPISTQTASSTTIPAGKQKEFFITLPTDNNKPLVYVSHISFFDDGKNQRLTNLDVRYIVQGDIATIQTVTADKKFFEKGDNVAVTLGYSGTPFDITTGKNPVDANYDTEVKLLNDQKQWIASWTGVIDYNATNTKTIVLTAQQPANGYNIEVVVTKAGKTITNYSIKISPDLTKSSASSSLFPSVFGWQYIVFGLVLGTIIIFIVFMRRNKKSGGLFLILFILISFSFLALNYSTIIKVWAQVTSLTESSYNSGSNYILVTASAPVPDAEKKFLLNEPFTVAGSVVTQACTNSLPSIRVGVTIWPDSKTTSDTANLSDTAYDNYIDSACGGSGQCKFGNHLVAFDVPIDNGSIGGLDYLAQGVYTIPVIAPSEPGKYKMYTHVETVWGWGAPHTIWEGVQEITVEAPPVLSASCSASSGSVSKGQSSILTATPSGGNGIYSYDWNQAGCSEGNNTSNCTKTYNTIGTSASTVYVTSGNQTISATCSVNVVTPTCDASPTSEVQYCSPTTPQVGGTWHYVASCSETAGDCRFDCPATYTWNGTSCNPPAEDGVGTCVAHTSSSGTDKATFANVGQLVTWEVTGGIGPSYVWYENGIQVASQAGGKYQTRYSTIGNRKITVTDSGNQNVKCLIGINRSENFPVVNDPNFNPF